MADLLMTTRVAMNNAGMHGKTIGYSTRYNAFWNDTNRPDGYAAYDNDGEVLRINQVLKDTYISSFAEVVDMVNIMFYD